MSEHRGVTAVEVFMRRRYAEYRPTWRWRFRRAGLRKARAVQLNAVGWAVVALLCLAGAGIGYASGRLVGVPGWVGALAGGAVVMLMMLIGLGHRQRVSRDDAA